MKYVAIIDSDDELLEDAIKNLKDTLFLGDENAMYCFEITSIKKVPEMMKTELRDNVRVKDIKSGYNQALWDCGVR
jgi:hypothetical protein